MEKIGLVKNKKLVFLSLGILVTFLGRDVFGLVVETQTPVLQISTGTTIYDFLAHAPEASWSSGAGALPFPGDPSDSRGFARYVNNALLEDGTTWSKVLETHPQWVSGGWISGAYPQQTVQSNTQLTIRVGFLSGATGTDGVRFDVYFDEYRGLNVAPLRHTIVSQFATLDGKLDLVTKDLSSIAGKKGNFVLYVYAGQTSNKDWAVWAEARLETKPLPDLVITDVWESVGLVYYKVKNIGDAATTPTGMPTKSFWNCLSVDGKQVARHCVAQVLQPGQEVEGVFNYTWQPTPGEHVVRACADCDQNIEESNEGNNCLEEKWLVENLPDLVITGIMCDRNNSMIGYMLENVGSELARGNHSTTLYVDGVEVAHDVVLVDLRPGEVYKSMFKDYEWPECHNITVKVCADNYNQVKESNEGNNCLEKFCTSYPVPILITSGPSFVNVTQDSVTIIWSTNKRSDSTVIYSDRSTGEEETVYNANLVKDHVVRITGLKPRKTYKFHVKSKDPCGNFVVSKTMVFETMSPPDDDKPSVILFLPERLIGVVNISASASDNVGVEGVMFSIDGFVKFTDFSPPYVWVCNTTLFPNGSHSFDAIAFDAAGNRAVDVKNGTIANPLFMRANPPRVQISKPSDEGWVHDLVEIEVSISTMPLLYIKRVELYIDGVLVGRSIYPSFHVNPLTGEVVIVPATSDLTFTHLWNATGLEPNSEHTIGVKAWDDLNNYGYDSIRVKIFSMISMEEYLKMKEIGVIKIIDIEVTRNVVRYENWFDVSLTIRNIGNVALEHFDIRDPCMGFQAIALPMPATSRDTEVSYDWRCYRSIVRIIPLMGRLNPGESWTFHYYAVPILFGSGRGFIRPHVIGGFETTVSFQCEGTDYHKIFRISQDPDNEDWDGNGRTELEDAFNSVDYLIITNPERLFANYPGDRDGVNLLLQEAAVLAKIKHGVLGYIEGYTSPEGIKILLAPYLPSGRYFIDGQEFFGSANFLAQRLPAFRNGSDAYLLIVGETEIVPAKDINIMGIEINCSDNYYADVVGEDGKPDLIVGRIVGNNTRELFNPIDASISVYLRLKEFNYLNVLTVSGYEYGESFVVATEDTGNMLAGQGFSIDKVHTDTYDITEAFLREALVKLNTTDFDPNTKKPEPPDFLKRGIRNIRAIAGKYDFESYTTDLIDPPTDLDELLALISVDEAELVEEWRRGFHLDYTTWSEKGHEDLVVGYVQAQRAMAIKEKARGKGVILWYGHGSPGGWACVLDAKEGSVCSIGTGEFTDYDTGRKDRHYPIVFENHPIVYAHSCLTGQYKGIYGMPEAFFRYGAAVYMGFTPQVRGGPSRYFFSQLKEYLDNGRPVGLLFRDMKRNERWDDIIGWDKPSMYMFNYYGDPKYGGWS